MQLDVNVNMTVDIEDEDYKDLAHNASEEGLDLEFELENWVEENVYVMTYGGGDAWICSVDKVSVI